MPHRNDEENTNYMNFNYNFIFMDLVFLFFFQRILTEKIVWIEKKGEENKTKQMKFYLFSKRKKKFLGVNKSLIPCIGSV